MDSLDAGVAQLPADFTDVGGVAKSVFDAVQNHQWGLVASLGVLLVIALTRKFTSETSKFGVWVNSKLGALISNFVLSFGGAFATMFAAGQPFTWKMVLQAFTIALTASGGWSIWKNFNEAMEERKAQAAGTAVAADPSKTTDTLNK